MFGGPPFDDELGGGLVEVRDDNFGDVGDERLALGSLTCRLVGRHRPGGNGPAGDLRLARPPGLLAFYRVEGGAMQGEARVASEVGGLA